MRDFKLKNHSSKRFFYALLIDGVVEYTDEGPGYDIKRSDDEDPVMLEFWGMQSIPSLPLLSGPLWPGVVALDRALSMG